MNEDQQVTTGWTKGKEGQAEGRVLEEEEEERRRRSRGVGVRGMGTERERERADEHGRKGVSGVKRAEERGKGEGRSECAEEGRVR